MLSSPTRHEPLADDSWSEHAARAAIARIVERTNDEFVATSEVWPLHPDDAEDESSRPMRGLYMGAAGIVWALLELTGEADPDLVDRLDAGMLAEPDDGVVALPSWMLGRSGILALAQRLRPDPARADELAAIVEAHIESPAGELVYGNPGTMVAAAGMWERTGDERWARLWKAGAERLLADREADGSWTQRVSSRHGAQKYVGAGHGLAGNAWCLLQGGTLLADSSRRESERSAIATLTRLAVVEDGRANWSPFVGMPLALSDDAIRVQWCHGAPGIITSLAGAGSDDTDWTRLLEAGGRLTWEAGPLSTGIGICHGTAGNGYAFLALWKRTGDEFWLERARRFALHAAGQVERNVARWGFARHSLFTGDIGVALFLRACIDGDPRIPTLDWL